MTRMYRASRYTMVWSLALAMIAAVGCDSGGDNGAETKAESDGQETAESVEGTQPSTPPGSDIANPSGKPRVLIKTNLGSITVELEPEKASITVDNFLRYITDEHYTNTIFHWVEKDYVVIGGSFTADLKEKPVSRQPIYNEARDGMSNLRATIAMSRLPNDRNSATCQFFFNLADNSRSLDYKESPDGTTADQDCGYCVFGTVVEGMSVVEAIGNVPVESRGDFDTIPVENVVIQSMREVP